MGSDAEGSRSELFDYFKVLCIQGFLAARKHADRIVCLVEMMQASGAPCFKGGAKVLTNIRRRFAPGRPEEACVEVRCSYR
jgi:phosphatidylinositol kinase/protein kinase (PI-3  family)